MPEVSGAESLQGGRAAAAAIVAVFAALATLFSNHSSISGLEKRTLAGIMQTRAADQYNYYESSRIKIEINQALEQSGVVRDAAASRAMDARVAEEETRSANVLRTAAGEETQANTALAQAERSLSSYERYEVSATLFDVSVVLISITALARGTKLVLWLAGAVTLVGAGYFIAGALHF